MSWLDTLETIRTKDFGRASAKERATAARDVVNLSAYACAAVAISPMPFSDAVVMLPIQSTMVMTVGHIYGRQVTKADAKALIMELGATFGASMLARQGIKVLLPVVGPLLTIPAAFAANWAIGRVAIEYFKNPQLGHERLKSIYEEAKREGAGLFSKHAFDKYRSGKGAAKPASKKKATRRKSAGRSRPSAAQ